VSAGSRRWREWLWVVLLVAAGILLTLWLRGR
jgi:hypothetical protein